MSADFLRCQGTVLLRTGAELQCTVNKGALVQAEADREKARIDIFIRGLDEGAIDLDGCVLVPGLSRGVLVVEDGVSGEATGAEGGCCDLLEEAVFGLLSHQCGTIEEFPIGESVDRKFRLQRVEERGGASLTVDFEAVVEELKLKVQGLFYGADGAGGVAAGSGEVDVNVGDAWVLKKAIDSGGAERAFDEVGVEHHAVCIEGAKREGSSEEHLWNRVGCKSGLCGEGADVDSVATAERRGGGMVFVVEKEDLFPDFSVGQADAAGEAGLLCGNRTDGIACPLWGELQFG